MKKTIFLILFLSFIGQVMAQDKPEFNRFGLGLSMGKCYYSYYKNYPFNKVYFPVSDYASFAVLFNYYFSNHFNIGTRLLFNKTIRIDDLAYNEFTKQWTKQKDVHSIYELPLGFNFTIGQKKLRISTGLNTSSFQMNHTKSELYVRDSNNVIIESHRGSKTESHFLFIHPSLNLGIQYNFTPSIPFAMVNPKNDIRVILKPNMALRFEVDYQFCNLLEPYDYEYSFFMARLYVNFSLFYLL